MHECKTLAPDGASTNHIYVDRLALACYCRAGCRPLVYQRISDTMALKLPYEQINRMRRDALSKGEMPTSLIGSDYHVCGKCTQPVGLTFKGLSDRFARAQLGDNLPQHNYIDVYARCRVCYACLQARGFAWHKRCATELVAARIRENRTWFITFTFKGDFHLYALGALGVSHGGWPGVARIANRHVTLWLKRMRKQSSFRYMVAVEAHQSGVPHLHALIHETDSMRPVREREMRRCWRSNGYLHAKLVDDTINAGIISNYICKYISKALLARVRASKGYGTDGLQP